MVENPMGVLELLFLFFIFPLLMTLGISIGKILFIKSDSNLTTKLIYVFAALITPIVLTLLTIKLSPCCSSYVLILLIIVIFSPVCISTLYSIKYEKIINSNSIGLNNDNGYDWNKDKNGYDWSNDRSKNI